MRCPRPSFVYLWLTVWLVAACGNDAPPAASCTPGKSEPCACSDGAAGAQRCLADGTFGECLCDGVTPDGGAPPSDLDAGAPGPDLGPSSLPVDSGLGPEIDVTGGLPNGSLWVGTLRYMDSQGTDSSAKWHVRIFEDTITRDPENVTEPSYFERISYRGGGVADWLNQAGEVLGSCMAAGGRLTCSSAAGQPAQEVIERTFREHGLTWSARGTTPQQVSYEQTGTLTRVP